MATTATPNIGLRATAGKRTLRFGLVNVGVVVGAQRDCVTEIIVANIVEPVGSNQIA